MISSFNHFYLKSRIHWLLKRPQLRVLSFSGITFQLYCSLYCKVFACLIVHVHKYLKYVEIIHSHERDK